MFFPSNIYLYNVRDGAVGIVILYKFDSLEHKLQFRQEVFILPHPFGLTAGVHLFSCTMVAVKIYQEKAAGARR